MTYLPHTEQERSAMLEAIGAKSLEDLFSHLPQDIRCGEFDLPLGLGEMELTAEMGRLAQKNRSTAELPCFLGAGAYDHFIPPVVGELASRGELYTAYTPYQPEISQGILQAIYEYQTMISSLCGCDVANASLYDGATAVVEGLQMAIRHSRRSGCVILDGALHPNYIATVKTALEVQDIEVRVAPTSSDRFDSQIENLVKMAQEAGEGLAGVAVGYPNFFGAVEDLTKLSEEIHKLRAIVVAVGNPFAYGLLKPPGSLGVDIVCGEAQSVGVPLQFGGPYLGFVASTQALVRKMPGRLVGKTEDIKGRQSFTLTLQAREQHIRREKATSNICTNTALCALMAHFYMITLGRGGLKRAGELAVSKADLLRRKLKDAGGVSRVPDYPVFHEFVIETKKPAAEVLEQLLDAGLLGGLDLGRYFPDRANQILVCVTEKRTEAEIEAYVKAIG